MNSTFKENSNKVHAKPSRGLEYMLLRNGTYAVLGFGICKDIVIPKTHNGKLVTEIIGGAFCGCTGIESVVIPNSVVSIGDCAFCGCSSLTKITISDSVTRIGAYAFCNCLNLTNITIPDSVINIGDHAFSGCNELKKLGKWKATNSHRICRDYKFSLGKWHEESEAKLCKKGFHFCENAFDLFNYYHGTIGRNVRFFEIETESVSDETEEDSKRVCKKIKLVREIKSYAELLN